MIFSAAIAASLLALVGADTHQYSDELITALMRSAKEHNLVGGTATPLLQYSFYFFSKSRSTSSCCS